MNQSQLKGRRGTPLRYSIMNQSQLKGRHVTPLRYIITNQRVECHSTQIYYHESKSIKR